VHLSHTEVQQRRHAAAASVELHPWMGFRRTTREGCHVLVCVVVLPPDVEVLERWLRC
jgi:hypothetical protein